MIAQPTVDEPSALVEEKSVQTRLRRILDSYADASIAVEIGDVASFEAREDLEAAVWKKVERSGPLYPRCLWDDPELQLRDARALVAPYGVLLPELRLPRGDVLATCRAIVDAANVALAKAGEERRFFAIAHCPIRDPISRWILVTPRQLSVLASRGILTSTPVERTAAPARPAIARRIAAKLIDAVVCGGTVYGFSRHFDLVVAILLGYGWFVLSDWSGSFGKWMFGLRTVDHQTGRACTPLQSLLRNVPFLASALPRPFSAIAVALQVTECLKAANDPEGRRWGDQLAKTVVMPRLPR